MRGSNWESFAVLHCLLVLFVSGCREDVQGNDEPGRDTDSDTPVDTDTETAVDSDTVSDSESGEDTDSNVDATDPAAFYTGMWGGLINVSIIQTGIPLINSQYVVARNWVLVTVEKESDGKIVAYEKICANKTKLEESSVPNYSITPQNFIDHLELMERRVAVTSSSPGTPWRSDLVYSIRGANLCDPINDPLPGNGTASVDDSTSCQQACTNSHCDQDEDGHPGMTSILSGTLNCEVYITQRWSTRFDGEIVDENTIAGQITDNFSEQTVLASNNFLCDQGNPGTADPNCSQHQYFKMVRLPNSATCDHVLELTRCAGQGADESTCESAGTGDTAALPLDPNEDLPSDCEL